jgi:hypothetical protein
MWYVPQHESRYSVSVTEDSQTGDWTIAKAQGKVLGKVTAVDSARGGLIS